MSFGFGVSDVVAAAELAWKVYSACIDAPIEFKVLSQEVEAMHIVLESIRKSVLDAGLDENRRNDLNRVSRGSITVLTELEALLEKYSSLGSANRRTWDKLRWPGAEKITSLRARLTSNISLLTAFNSSLMNVSQANILTRLDQVLVEIQEGSRQSSAISKLPIEGRDDVWRQVAEELGADPNLQANRALIIPRIEQALYPVAWQSGIEIISATYGTMDVSRHMRQFFHELSTGHRNSVQTFIPSNGFFGHDPLPNSRKVFVLLWRMKLTPIVGDRSEQPGVSGLQKVRVLEGLPVTITPNNLFRSTTPPAKSPKNPLILDASYFNIDVTPIVTRIVARTQPGLPIIIQANTSTFGTADPAPNNQKQLSITYAYPSLDGSNFENHVCVVVEGETIVVPPQLTIHVAYWAGLDVTNEVRVRVTPEQTLEINTDLLIHISDPWYNVSKTLSIMYQYSEGPLQLLVTHDGAGVSSISPDGPPRRMFFNPTPQQRHDEKGEGVGIYILAVVWGVMYGQSRPISPLHFRWITEKGRFPCSNDWFGFDSYPGWRKTCHVFYRFGSVGRIQCRSAREGEEWRLS